jgi:hypothetical protein
VTVQDHQAMVDRVDQVPILDHREVAQMLKLYVLEEISSTHKITLNVIHVQTIQNLKKMALVMLTFVELHKSF